MELFYLLIIFIGFTIWFFIRTKAAIHILQQNSYLNVSYLGWIRKNIQKAFSFADLLAVVLFFACYFLIKNNLITSIVFALVYIISALSRKKVKAKKPLVITSRVKRLIYLMLILYAVFVFFVFKVPLLTGALAFFLLGFFNCFFVILVNLLIRPLELMINRWYYNDAKKLINGMKNLRVIGITGSYGKTSSKFILAKMLGEKYNTLFTPESYNTTMGVIKTVRTSLLPTHQVFVCEMGAKYVNDIKEICDLVSPDYGFITSIGPQHLETFKSVENIVNTKFELKDAVKNKAHMVLNYSSELIAKNNKDENAIKYTLERAEGIDYYAENIAYGSFGLSFTLCDKSGNKTEIKTKLLGIHNVLNIIGAAAVARLLDVEYDKIARAVYKLMPVPHRLELKSMAGGINVIDDAFNSNLEGAKSAVNVLGSFEKGGRILITPGIVELSNKHEEYNFEFGREASKHCDYIILVGKKQTKPISDGIAAGGFSMENVYAAEDLNDALAKMRQIAKSGSTVLFENDLPDLYNE